jgi:hypothetical protein
MNARITSKCVVVLGALALFVVAYAFAPAFAEEQGAKARESKQAPGMQQSPAGPVGGAATAPGTSPDTPSEAAGGPPPQRPPVPESERATEPLDIPEGAAGHQPPRPRPRPPPPPDEDKRLAIDPRQGKASAGRVEPPDPTPGGPSPPPEAGVIGDFGGEAMSEGDARTEALQPPVPGSGDEPPPRPPGPVEAPPGN